MKLRVEPSTEAKKAELQKQLNDIAEKEHADMLAKHLPEFKKLEGKFFKHTNRYSGSKSWWVYTKVLFIQPEDVYMGAGNRVLSHYKGFCFQTCVSGNINIDNVKHGYVHSLGKQITEKEFNEAWDKMVDKINSL